MNTKKFSAVYPADISAEIENALLSFSDITHLPVSYYDDSGALMREYGSRYKICRFLKIYGEKNSICRKTICSAINTAADLGEPYFFVCSAGFVNIAVPLMNGTENHGCFIAGPVIMEKLSHKTVSKLLSLNMSGPLRNPGKVTENDTDSMSRVIITLHDLYIYSSGQVSSLAALLNNSIIANLSDTEGYTQVNARYKEQVRIGDDLRRMKSKGQDTHYPRAAEKDLLKSISSGSSKNAHISMTAFLNGILLCEAGNLDAVKIHLIELCALVSRNGESEVTESMTKDSFEYINALNKTASIQELKKWAEDFVDHFLGRGAESFYSGDSQIIRNAVQAVTDDETFRLSLSKTAAAIHINASYLSSHFKKETGINFTDFLNQKRISKAKELLKKTNLHLLDISEACGFENQSYFSKVFRRGSGMSPQEYRKKIRNTQVRRPVSPG